MYQVNFKLWKIFQVRFFLPVLLVFVLSVLCGCGILKTKEIITTKTTIKADTIIRLHIDVFPVIKEGYDTVKVENTTSFARSYINGASGKIILELKGKDFNVPVTIQQTTVETKKDVITKQKFPYIYIFLLILIPLCLFVIAFIIKKYLFE